MINVNTLKGVIINQYLSRTFILTSILMIFDRNYLHLRESQPRVRFYLYRTCVPACADGVMPMPRLRSFIICMHIYAEVGLFSPRLSLFPFTSVCFSVCSLFLTLPTFSLWRTVNIHEQIVTIARPVLGMLKHVLRTILYHDNIYIYVSAIFLEYRVEKNCSEYNIISISITTAISALYNSNDHWLICYCKIEVVDHDTLAISNSVL